MRIVTANRIAAAVPAPAWFGVSAIFHYLGPACAVLLFPRIGVLGVAWLRIASAAVLFALLTHPWRLWWRVDAHERWLLVSMGASLAFMNCSFYLALARLPLSVVSAIEFVGVLAIAVIGLATLRNLAALALAMLGGFLLINVRWSNNWAGIGWAGLNGAFFVVYVVLGHRMSRNGALEGIERLGVAMAVAMLVVFPIGFGEAQKAFDHPLLLLAAFGVGVCSSVIPYTCDQLAMARLPRASFALLLTLLPAAATIIGAIVLGQMPTAQDLLGIGLVVIGVGLHRPMPLDPPGLQPPNPQTRPYNKIIRHQP